MYYVDFQIDDLQAVQSMYCIATCVGNCVINFIHNFITGLHELAQQCGPLEEFRELYYQVPHDKARHTDFGNQTLLYRYASSQGMKYSFIKVHVLCEPLIQFILYMYVYTSNIRVLQLVYALL